MHEPYFYLKSEKRHQMVKNKLMGKRIKYTPIKSFKKRRKISYLDKPCILFDIHSSKTNEAKRHNGSETCRAKGTVAPLNSHCRYSDPSQRNNTLNNTT